MRRRSRGLSESKKATLAAAMAAAARKGEIKKGDRNGEEKK